LVGVVDTGVDAAHPDLVGRVLPGADIYETGIDASTDNDGHGTRMAGVIAGTNSGNDGILGIAPEARILPIRIVTEYGSTTANKIAEGIQEAVNRGARVINVSWAHCSKDDPTSAINYAISKDVVVVAGSGNTAMGHSGVCWPANIPGVIAVTGTDRSGVFWAGSTQGPEAVVSAPATDILSAIPRAVSSSQYSIGNGTSDSTAIVSGIAALLRAKYPNMSAANVINRIIRTADDAGPAGRDAQYGYGKVNALKALTQDVPEVKTNPLVSGTSSSAPATTSAAVPQMEYASGSPTNTQGKNDRSVIYIGVGAGLAIVLLTIFVIRGRRTRLP
jgi:membrane-anchored mycosin MYCP